MPEYSGLLFIGDPHLASRTPGYRKDDYPRRILQKLAWSLEYAREHRLLPCILGDLFHLPRDNATWLVGELCALFVGREIVSIYGNHDCRENTLTDDDTFSLLLKAGLLKLLSETRPWKGRVNGREVIVGGSSWGEHPPGLGDIFWEGVSQQTLVFWMMHHDVRVPGYEEIGVMDPFELPGIHVVVNGHIHTKAPDIQRGRTRWMNPGNIARVKRSCKDHVPAVLRIDIAGDQYRSSYIEVPHEPHADVFHEEVRVEQVERDESAFVRGLAELQARRTTSGEGLQEFLDKNLDQFSPAVGQEIMRLAREVMESV